MAKALKMVSVGPVMVTILSGQLPSEILIRAPLWNKQHMNTVNVVNEALRPLARIHLNYLFPGKRVEFTSSRIFFTVSPF